MNKLELAMHTAGESALNWIQNLLVHNLINRPFDFQEEMKVLTFAIISEFVMGIPISELEKLNGGNSVGRLWDLVLSHVQKRYMPIPFYEYLDFKSYLKYQSNLKFLRDTISLSIDREIQKNTKSEDQRTLISYMVEQHLKYPESFTKEDIFQHSLTFLFAGHDTTSNLLTWMIYHIGNDEKIQQKCHSELEDMFGNKPKDYIPTVTEVKQLRYLKMVIKETLRLYPGAPLRGRKLTKDDNPMDKIVLPKDLEITIDIFSCHTQDCYWENPLVFDPERFSEEQEEKRPPHYWIPFGGGARRCIGEQFAMNQALVFITLLLRNFRVASDKNFVICRELALTMRSKYPVNITFIPK